MRDILEIPQFSHNSTITQLWNYSSNIIGFLIFTHVARIKCCTTMLLNSLHVRLVFLASIFSLFAQAICCRCPAAKDPASHIGFTRWFRRSPCRRAFHVFPRRKERNFLACLEDESRLAPCWVKVELSRMIFSWIAWIAWIPRRNWFSFFFFFCFEKIPNRKFKTMIITSNIA